MSDASRVGVDAYLTRLYSRTILSILSYVFPVSISCYIHSPKPACAQLTCTNARARDTPTRARSRPRHHVRHRLAHLPRRCQGGQVRRLQPRHARLAGTRARGLQNDARSRSDTSPSKPHPGSRACGGSTPARPPLFSRRSSHGYRNVSIAAYVTRMTHVTSRDRADTPDLLRTPPSVRYSNDRSASPPGSAPSPRA